VTPLDGNSVMSVLPVKVKKHLVDQDQCTGFMTATIT